MNATFASLSVVMSCVWLSLVASEVVALLQTFGMILNAPTVRISCMFGRDTHAQALLWLPLHWDGSTGLAMPVGAWR